MKKPILILSLLVLLALPCAGQGLLRSNVTLYWDYDPLLLTNMSFYVRGSPDVALPVSGWAVKAALIGTSNGPTATNVTIPLAPQEYFFVCQASNFWGLSDPSNIASVPPPPRSDVSLGVR